MAIEYNPRIVTDNLVLALDAGNKKSYSQNYHPNPTDIFSWYSSNSGTSNNATPSRDTIPSPVGNTPLKMVTTGNDSHIGTYNQTKWNLGSAVSGQTWTVSVWARASAATTGQIFIFEANSSGTYVQAPSLNINITTEWQRFSYSYTFVNVTTTNIQTRLDGAAVLDGATIWWDGLQVERSSSVTDFTSSYTGDNILNLLGSGSNGTLVNGPSYNGSNGGSILFNSTGSYVQLNVNSYGITDAYTVSFWVKRIGGTGVFLYIGQSTTTGMYFENYTNTDLYTWFFGPSAAQNNGNWGANALSTTQWTNVTMTMVTSTKTQTRYLNGVISGSPFVFTNAVTAPSGTQSWLIKNNSQTWSGYISDLKIYNRALTEAEVSQNFNALRGRFGI